MRTSPGVVATLLLVLTLGGSLILANPAPEAPEWSISEWINGDPGSLADQRGRVVLIHFFQRSCPGCNSFSIPLFRRWEERYGGRDDVLLVSIHRLFEGHGLQNNDRLREFIREKGIRHPVGVDAHEARSDLVPVTMRRYQTAGTPHVVIIDKNRRIRFSRLGSFDIARAEALIVDLLADGDPGGRPGASAPSKTEQR